MKSNKVISFKKAPNPSNSNTPKINVTILGDSTIDNKIWISPGVVGNYMYDRLGIKPDNTQTRIAKSHRLLFRPELSVVENIIDQLPDCKVSDYTNDGFTTHDCLNGAYRDKVFGVGTFSMFPHEYFAPLKAATNDIKNSQYIILSIGGNNFREFLMQARRIRDADERQDYIKNNFEGVFNKLKDEYLEIVHQIRNLNQDATIILMTQYYPSFSQNNYNIYSFMQELGHALNIGTDPDNPRDVIHEIMKKTYTATLQAIPSHHVVVADVTSSLDPFDSHNHVHQIEPSGVGGKKIAEMLAYIIKNANNSSGVVYRFPSEFFANKELKNPSLDNPVEQISFTNWVPRHPAMFDMVKSSKIC